MVETVSKKLYSNRIKTMFFVTTHFLIYFSSLTYTTLTTEFAVSLKNVFINNELIRHLILLLY